MTLFYCRQSGDLEVKVVSMKIMKYLSQFKNPPPHAWFQRWDFKEQCQGWDTHWTLHSPLYHRHHKKSWFSPQNWLILVTQRPFWHVLNFPSLRPWAKVICSWKSLYGRKNVIWYGCTSVLGLNNGYLWVLVDRYNNQLLSLWIAKPKDKQKF